MNGANKRNGTILVVEDYEDVRRMLKMLLEADNYRVLEAATGTEALNVVQNTRPDVILMDRALPGFDGFETIRRIRKIDGFQNTPIIVLTAHSGGASYESAIRAGSNFFMAKPIDFDELTNLLEHIMVHGKNRVPNYGRSTAQRAMMRNEAPPSRREFRAHIN